MESSSILKLQAPPFIPRTSIPTTYLPLSVALLRNEFLSGDYNLRPPEGLLNCRRKCKKLGWKTSNRYYKSLCRASLGSQPTIVVPAVATFSALTVLFFTYSKNGFNVMQMSGQLFRALSEQIRSMTNWILPDAHSIDILNEASDGSKDLMKETAEANQVDKEIVSEFNFRAIDANQAPLEFNVATSVTAETMELLTVLENFEVQPDLHVHQLTVADVLSSPTIQNNSNASLALTMKEESAKLGVNLEVLKEGDIHHNLFDRDSIRKGLYTIDKASFELLDPLEQLSSSSTSQKNTMYSLPMNNSLMNVSNIIAPKAFPSVFTEKREGELYRYSEGFLIQQKDSRKGKRLKNTYKYTNKKEITQKQSPSSNPKGNPMQDNRYPSWQLRVYNQLLREGRLIDCIELLEDLEEKGLLDMDKVYHVKFFEVCKNQNAVKEAFRFIRFIPNPTLSTFNSLMSVCASSQDSEGAFEVMQLVQDAGLKADCKLYTTLISTCAKSGKVDIMFKVFHEMVNSGVEPNLHTYGALIDGCAKAGQVAKAFGAYGILRSKNVKPDRVVFNALITACGQSGAVDRAFDVLADMRAELHPIDPDHITLGALMKACASSNQIARAREVYDMIRKYGVKGTAELYTIAVNSCSNHGDWEFACSVYDDMIKNDVAPDEMFISALIDVAGHAGKVNAAFEIMQEAEAKGMHVGVVSYSSLMGACRNARDWQKALDLYKDIKSLSMRPTVSMMNALITVLCDADQMQMAVEVLFEMKSADLCPNTITYSVLVVAAEKKDDLETGLVLLSEAKKDGIPPNLVMCRCILAMCLSRFQKACKFGDPVLSFTSGRHQIDNKWTSSALMVYRETIAAGTTPTMDELSLVLGCLQLPHDVSVRKRFIQNLGVNIDSSKGTKLNSFVDGFGEFDPRAISLIEEAASLGIVPFVSLKESLIAIDMRNFKVYTAEVYLLTVLKGLKHRLAAGVKLPNVTIFLPVKNMQVKTSAGEKAINISGRISQAIAGSLRRLGIAYHGNESYGKIRINGVSIRKQFQPKLESRFARTRKPPSSSFGHLRSGLARQQSKIRTGHLSIE